MSNLVEYEFNGREYYCYFYHKNSNKVYKIYTDAKTSAASILHKYPFLKGFRFGMTLPKYIKEKLRK